MRTKANVPHPIPYQGSKRQIADTILSYFPALKVDRLVEPFAGSAAISLAAAYHDRAASFLISDAHKPIVDLWKEIIERPHQLAQQYAELWESQLGREREFYDEVRGRFNAEQRPDLFFYLLARCVKACIRYNSDGKFNNSPDNRRKGARPATMRERIVGASQLLSGRVEVRNEDYQQILANCDPSDLIYMDPPYQGVGGKRDNRYAPKVDHAEFCEALAELNAKKCRYLVSYDGRTGDKTYGDKMPEKLALLHVEVHAGRSSQATLLGRAEQTVESLYISPTLAKEIARRDKRPAKKQLTIAYPEALQYGEKVTS